MLHRTLRITFALAVLSATYALVARDSKDAPPPAPAKQPEKKPAQAAPQAATPAGGVVVFIDPATGKIRQPDASEIGALTGSPGPIVPRTPTPPVLMQGPGGAVGARLGEESLTYMVVTKAPDGKLAMDCVTGAKAASARVVSSPDPKDKETSKVKEPHDGKQAPRN